MAVIEQALTWRAVDERLATEQDPAVAPSAEYANRGFRNLRRLADAQAFA